MKKNAILLLSHGSFASGTLKTAEMFAGPSDRQHVQYLELVPEDNIQCFEEKVFRTIDELFSTHEQVIILTDLIGGSPNNIAMKYALTQQRGVVVTGYNLPFVLELLTNLSQTIQITEYLEHAHQAFFEVQVPVSEEEEEDECL